MYPCWIKALIIPKQKNITDPKLLINSVNVCWWYICYSMGFQNCFFFFFPQENFITPAVFAEIIYNNYLFDIPKILDLCVLFGKGNSQLLHKMIGT